MNMRADVHADQGASKPERLLERPAERLVVTGFRCWMAGYEHGSIECWEVAWNEYARELGAVGARRAFGDLQYWIRTIRDAAQRNIECFPYCCNCVCRDECMALSIISALQEGKRDLARTAAYHLTGAPHSVLINSVTDAAEEFAGALLEADKRLIPVTASVVDSIANHNTDPRENAWIMH